MKKLIISLLCLCLPLAVMTSCSVEQDNKEDTNKNNELNYISLGDSIASGYALPEYSTDPKDTPDSYTYLLKQSLNPDNYRKLSVTGQTSTELLGLIDEMINYHYTDNTNLYTIAIGANDILQFFWPIAATALQVYTVYELYSLFTTYIDNQDYVGLMNAVSAIKTELEKPATDQLIRTGIDQYKINFISIVDKLIANSNNPKIVIINQYNPFAGVDLFGFDFGGYIQTYLDIINEFYDTHAYKGTKFFVADVSKMDSSLTNVKIDVENNCFDIDPHPSVAGHLYIYNKIYPMVASMKAGPQILQ